MRHFILILLHSDLTAAQVVYTTDIIKTMKFYNGLSNLNMSATVKPNILFYIEEPSSKESALKRLNKITNMPLSEKKKIIVTANPNYIELVVGQNIEL